MAGLLVGDPVGAVEIARDVAGRDPEVPRGGDEDVASGPGRRRGAARKPRAAVVADMGRLGVEAHLAVDGAEKPVQAAERIGVDDRRRRRRANARISGSAAARADFAQVEEVRQALDRAAHDPVRVAGLDLAATRIVMSSTGPSAENMCTMLPRLSSLRPQPAVDARLDAPAQDVLAVVVPRRQAQDLDRARGPAVRSGRRCRAWIGCAWRIGSTGAGPRDRRVPDHVRYCSAMAAPSRLFSVDEVLMNSCRPCSNTLSMRVAREPGQHVAGEALARAAAAVGVGDEIEVADQDLVAVGERARHLPVEDQEVRDEPGLDALAVDPVVGGQRRDLAQDRGPLEIVEGAADALGLAAAARGTSRRGCGRCCRRARSRAPRRVNQKASLRSMVR